MPLYEFSQQTVLKKKKSNKKNIKTKYCLEWSFQWCICQALSSTSWIFFSPAFYLSGPLEGDAILKEDVCDGVCLVCSCISITNPQSHSTSQTSSPKVSERSRASAIADESCVSMVLWADLAAAAAAAHTVCTSDRTFITLCLTTLIWSSLHFLLYC